MLVTIGSITGAFSYEQDPPVNLMLNNSANVTQTFEVTVVDAQKDVSVELNDGRSGNVSIGQGVGSTSSGKYDYTAVNPPVSPRHYGNFTLEPGEVKKQSTKKFPKDAAVVVVLCRATKAAGGQLRAVTMRR